MERRKKILQGAAVVSALVLVGSFVAYSAGAFTLTRPAQPQPEPDPQPGAVQQPDSQPEPGKAPVYMSGSKYIVLTPPPAGTPAADSSNAAVPPAILYGSKSAPIVTLPPPNPGRPAGPGPTSPPPNAPSP
jgi:hypothetical protein